jgi:hypothetical protein
MKNIWTYVIVFVFLAGLGTAFYFYYQDSQKKMFKMASDISTLQISNEMQSKTIDVLVADSKLMKTISEKIQEAQKTSQKAVSDLANTFRKMTLDGQRDIGNLAQARPDSIERIVNNGTKKVFRCMEISTGNPLTEEERKEYDETGKLRDCPGTVLP